MTFLSLDDCAAYVSDKIFRLRPSDYGSRYPQWPGLVGLEAEALVLKKGSQPELVRLYDGDPNLSTLLLEIAHSQGWAAEFYQDDHGKDLMLRVLLDEDDQLTFEPGGQLEISSSPYPCLSDALDRVEAVYQVLHKGLAQHDCELLYTGINPWHSVDIVGLQMSKPRYRAMDQYFSRISELGRRMMRQTCTVQVNLDFGDDENMLAKRYLVANLISPFATAIFANSPWVNGDDSGLASARSLAWRHIDPSRSGIPDLSRIVSSMNKQSCVDVYVDSLLDAPVVFIESLDFRNPPATLTFRRWIEEGFEGVRPTLQDFETHVSLHFPEVRPRGFLELRQVDGQARVWQPVVAAFFTGLLYDAQNLETLLMKLSPLQADLEQMLLAAAQGPGEGPLHSLCNEVMTLALEGFRRLPPCFEGKRTTSRMERFFDHFTARGRCPADDLRDQFVKAGQVLPHTFRQLEDKWQELVE